MSSYTEVLQALGERAKQLRIFRELKQDELAARAGVSTVTVQRFEHKGRSSIENVLRIATVLGVEEGFERLFGLPRYRSLDEALAQPAAASRQRVRKRRRP